jgi:hypothetical protein
MTAGLTARCADQGGRPVSRHLPHDPNMAASAVPAAVVTKDNVDKYETYAFD